MTLKIAICDDEAKDREFIRTFLNLYSIHNNINIQVYEFDNPNDLLDAYQNSDSFQAAFLDMEMPQMNGIELAKKIRKFGTKELRLVFVTNYPKYMQDSFPVQPIRYLIKPVSTSYLQETMDCIVTDYENSHILKIVIDTEGSEKIINISNLISVSTAATKRNKLIFSLSNQEVTANGVYGDWETILQPYQFFECHKGILINLKYVQSIESNTVLLTNGTRLPLSRRKEKELKNIFSRKIIMINNY